MGEVAGSIKVVVGVAVVVILAGAGAIGVYFDLEFIMVVVVIIVAPLVWVAGVQTMVVVLEGVEMGVPMG